MGRGQQLECYYFKRINSVFNAIENLSKCKILVACHPSCDPLVIQDAFPNFEVIKGESAALTKSASKIILHGSSSITFAVFAKKPMT